MIRGRKNVTRNRYDKRTGLKKMNFSKLTLIMLKLKSNEQAKQQTNAVRNRVTAIVEDSIRAQCQG